MKDEIKYELFVNIFEYWHNKMIKSDDLALKYELRNKKKNEKFFMLHLESFAGLADLIYDIEFGLTLYKEDKNIIVVPSIENYYNRIIELNKDALENISDTNMDDLFITYIILYVDNLNAKEDNNSKLLAINDNLVKNFKEYIKSKQQYYINKLKKENENEIDDITNYPIVTVFDPTILNYNYKKGMIEEVEEELKEEEEIEEKVEEELKEGEEEEEEIEEELKELELEEGEEEEHEEGEENICIKFYEGNKEDDEIFKVNSKFVKSCTLLNDVYKKGQNLFLPKQSVPLKHLEKIYEFSKKKRFSNEISEFEIIDTVSYLGYIKAYQYLKNIILKEIITRKLPIHVIKKYLDYYPTKEEMHNINKRFFIRYDPPNPDLIEYI